MLYIKRPPGNGQSCLGVAFKEAMLREGAHGLLNSDNLRFRTYLQESYLHRTSKFFLENRVGKRRASVLVIQSPKPLIISEIGD